MIKTLEIKNKDRNGRSGIKYLIIPVKKLVNKGQRHFLNYTILPGLTSLANQKAQSVQLILPTAAICVANIATFMRMTTKSSLNSPMMNGLKNWRV